jgi:nucleoside-diphosphate-sugar epimerase
VTPSFVVLGAGGFLGRTLIGREHGLLPVKAVVRSLGAALKDSPQGVTWVAADLSSPDWGREVLSPGDVVVNLAYAAGSGTSENLALIDGIIAGCVAHDVSRLVHCSTAVVVGSAKSRRVTEDTPCEPWTPYERTKWAVEQRVLEAGRGGLDVGIARPTAIVGAGGKNLESLVRSLLHGNPVVNYLRASTFGSRPMHLVPVGYVTTALLHIAATPGPLRGRTYLISADDDPDNGFDAVEAVLRESLGLGRRRAPLLPLPRIVLETLLRLRGRSETHVDRIYSPDALRTSGCAREESLASAVRAFATSFRSVSA